MSSLVGQLIPFLLLAAGFLGCTARSIGPVYDDLSELFRDVCGFPMGKNISDHHMTASSSLPDNKAWMARFNLGLAGWRPEVSDADQWIRVDLPLKIPVNAVLTQGSAVGDFYVTKYKVEYSFDAEYWACVMDEHSQPKIFEGNTDNSTPKINKFHPAVKALYIRIQPIEWHKAIALRLEVFGGDCPKCSEN